MAEPLGLDPATPEQAKLIAAVRARLEALPGWLLVFDNAEEPATLRDYLPRQGGGHVLLTSRRTDWRGVARALPLDVLPETEALNLLSGCSSLDAAGLAEANNLARELGFLPLALAQARAYLDMTGIGLTAYRSRLAERRAHLLARGRASPDYPLPVALTWQTSIEAAERLHPGARPLLELLSLFAPDAIPRELLGADPDALPEVLRDQVERDEAVGALGSFSLLRADPDTLTLHRLVQVVTGHGLDKATASARAETAVRLAAVGWPSGMRDHVGYAAVQAQLPHALAAAQAAATHAPAVSITAHVLDRMATYFQMRGAYGEATPLFEQAIAIGETTLGPEHPDLATLFNDLANLYQDTGRYAEAEPLYQRAVAIDENALGPDHPNQATGLNNLADLYRVTSRYAEAEPLLQRAMSITEKALGPDHPDLAIRLNNLAELYRNTGRYAEAEPLFQCAMNITEKALGPDHPGLAIRLNNLANLYVATGRYAEAEPLFQRAIAIFEQALGPDHPSVGRCLCNRAKLLALLGESDAARLALERALAIFEAKLPAAHPWIADAQAEMSRLDSEAEREG
jgi:tetratricopeptide (TPR) repeat protein